MVSARTSEPTAIQVSPHGCVRAAAVTWTRRRLGSSAVPLPTPKPVTESVCFGENITVAFEKQLAVSIKRRKARVQSLASLLSQRKSFRLEPSARKIRLFRGGTACRVLRCVVLLARQHPGVGSRCAAHQTRNTKTIYTRSRYAEAAAIVRIAGKLTLEA